MATIKTALSIDEKLFARADELAKELDVSRSRLFAMALKEFLERREAENLLEQINSVHGEATAQDEEAKRARRKKHRELVEGTW